MDQWQLLIDKYPQDVNVKLFTKVIDNAQYVFKEDLASFEIDWIVGCLFSKPVCLLSVLKKRRGEDAWSKVLGDSFVLIAKLLTTQTTYVEPYAEDIAETCLLVYAPLVRKRAIQCLSAAVTAGVVCTLHVNRLIGILSNHEETLSCRVPVAELLGVICEHRPELVEDSFRDIWRCYLYILEACKTTDTLKNAVVIGVNGLLTNFGTELSILELNSFYDKLTTIYINTKTCEKATIKLFASHSKLFPEKITEDETLRTILWNFLAMEKDENVKSALISVYNISTDKLTRDKLNTIITTDIYPKTSSKETQIKNTAFRILSNVINTQRHLISGDFMQIYERKVLQLGLKLEFVLQQKLDTKIWSETFEYDHDLKNNMEQASWLVYNKYPGSAILLRHLISLYAQCPPAHRRDYVIHTILCATPQTASGAISFLISECCQPPLDADSPKTGNIVKHLPIWRDLFDTRNGKDKLVLDKSKFIFEEFMNYLCFALDTFLERSSFGNTEETKEKLSILYHLASEVMKLENVREWVGPNLEYMLAACLECWSVFGASDGLVMFVKDLAEILNDQEIVISKDIALCLEHFYENLRIDRCTDEVFLCACCIALVQAPVGFLKDLSSALSAFQLLFSRDDVAAAVLLNSLSRLEQLLETKREQLDDERVHQIIYLIEKLRVRKHRDKDGRLLHRDIVLFLGKHGMNIATEVNMNETIMINIRDCVFLNLPNYMDGSNFKINLHRTLELAIVHEDCPSLHGLLLIIVSNSDILKNKACVGVVIDIVHRMCRCWCRNDGYGRVEDLEHAVAMVDCQLIVVGLIQCITIEKSPGVRKMLSTLVERALLVDPTSDTAQESLLLLIEQTSLMLASSDSITKRAGLDLTSTLITALKNNNQITKLYLTKILLLVTRTNENDFQITFEEITEFFFEKYLLFESNHLEEIVEELLKNLLNIYYNENVYRVLLEKSLGFIRKIFEKEQNMVQLKLFEIFVKNFDISALEDKIQFAKAISLLSMMAEMFILEEEVKTKIALFNDFYFLNYSLKIAKSGTVECYFIFVSIYDLLEQYADVFLEYKYQNTIELLSTIISTTPPAYMKRIYKKIQTCLQKYNEIWKNNQPQTITNSIHEWFKNLQINNLTKQLKNEHVITDNATVITAIKLMLKAINLKNTERVFSDVIYESIKSWSEITMRWYFRGFDSTDRTKMAALTDALTVALFLMRDDEVVSFVLEGQNTLSNDVTFCQKYIAALAPYLVSCQMSTAFVLRPHLTVLLRDLLRHCGMKKSDTVLCAKVLDLVDQNWQIICESTSPTPLQMLQYINDLGCKDGLSLDSRPGLWLLEAMSETNNMSDKIQYMEVLPAFLKNGCQNMDLLSSAVKSYDSRLPIRISELSARGESKALVALLDALSLTGNTTLLAIVIKMAAAEDTTGWWDTAISECMSALSIKADVDVALTIYRHIEKYQVLNTNLSRRLLVPLLRYSTQSFNEDFFSRTISQIIQTLRKTLKSTESTFLRMRNMVDHTNAMLLVQVMFEKVSIASLESPTSTLQKELSVNTPWHLPKEICKLCFSYRKRSRVEGDEAIFRQFQNASFNCMAAALSKRKADLKIFGALFADDVWPLIVDCAKEYIIRIEAQGKSNNKRHMVSVDTYSAHTSGQTALTRLSLTSRAVFLRTLSDNPLQYDFLFEEKAPEEVQTQELVLCDNELNSHECSATLSAILCQLSAMTDNGREYWIGKMAVVISSGDSPRNVRWFLSQIIINCKEELRNYFDDLIRPLWNVVSDTPYQYNGGDFLNGLHINILKAITHYAETDERTRSETDIRTDSLVLSRCIDSLIDTCFLHKRNKYVLKTLTGVFGDLLRLVHGVQVSWDKLKSYSEDPSAQETYLQLILLITKNNIYIPELLPNILTKLQNFDKIRSKLKEISELFGLAMAACQIEYVKNDSLRRFWLFLDKLRSKDVSSYIKMLYYAHLGYKPCVNENNFGIITDLAPKMTDTKEKCYAIISNFISNLKTQSEQITEMFDSINITETLLGENVYVSLCVAKNGLHLMEGSLRKRIVLLVCGFCQNTNSKVRRVSYELLTNAFRDTLTRMEFKEPLAKRFKSDTPTSPVIHCLLNEDLYTVNILGNLGRGAMDNDDKISGFIYEVLLEFLSKGDLYLRFCEIIALILVLPSKITSSEDQELNKRDESNSNVDISKCLTIVVKLWLHTIRGQESYRNKKLREEPLSVPGSSENIGPSKLLTLNRTYQGTFRTHSVSRRIAGKGVAGSDKSEINVQIPIDDVLVAFIKFAEKNPECSTVLFVELFKIITKQNGFSNLKPTMSAMLHMLIQDGCLSVLTPAILELCRVFVKECCAIEGFPKTVEKLYRITIGTEAECVTRLLYEDVKLHSQRQIIVFSDIDIKNDDITMMEASTVFSIEDLATAFGKLSNWNDLTIKQRADIQNSKLPILWTDEEVFKNQLNDYEGPEDWLQKYRSILLGKNTADHYRWLRDLDSWPRRAFTVSAITEACRIQMKPLEQADDLKRLSCDIKPSDCLAEWAARLMMRSLVTMASFEDSERSNVQSFTRQHELAWFSEANNRKLAFLTLKYIQRNTDDLLESETLPWLFENVKAMRICGIESNDRPVLVRALDKAETYLGAFREVSESEVILKMDTLILELSQDLGVQTPSKLDNILIDMRREYDYVGSKDTKNLLSLLAAHEMALLYYCGVLENCIDDEKLSFIKRAADITGDIVNWRPDNCDAALCLLLNQLSRINDDNTALEAVLYVFEQLEDKPVTFNLIILDELRRLQQKLPRSVCEKFTKLNDSLSRDLCNMATYKQWLHLVRSPDYALEQYCVLLGQILSRGDASEWKATFDKMYPLLFDNPQAGAGYRLLSKYRSDLDDIRQFESNDNFKGKAKRTLERVVRGVVSGGGRAALTLGDLCPSLAGYPSGGCEGDRQCLGRLLHVEHGLDIVRFDKQVKIFTNSIKRPAVLRALLGNGKRRAFLIKTGEDLRTDAACQYIQNEFNTITTYKCVTYKVTPLSEECGVIEYLEDSVTLRSLIGKTCHIEDIGKDRVRDDILILQPEGAAVSHHHALCQRVPVYVLRNAIENECSSVEEFIVKRKNFMDSLSAMTISHWILGLGDRHSDNIMVDVRSGRVCGVDWAAVLEQGARAVLPELTPARVTRVMIAVHYDMDLLESRMQTVLSDMRVNNTAIASVINMAFKWREDFGAEEFQNMLSCVVGKLRGFLLPHQVTRDVLRETKAKHWEKYIQILEDVFGDEEGGGGRGHSVGEQEGGGGRGHSVGEQVRGLLRQCTDVRVMSVTRAGWEPWL